MPTDGKRKKIFVTTFLPRPYFTEDVYSPLELPPSKKPPKSPMKKPPPIRFYLTFPRAPLGPNSGCFHSFPRHFPDPYEPVKKKGKKVKPKTPLHLIGDPGFKSKFTDSIVDRVTRVACNSVTYADYREQVYPLNWCYTFMELLADLLDGLLSNLSCILNVDVDPSTNNSLLSNKICNTCVICF